MISRRRLLGSAALAGSGLLLSGCDRLDRSPAFRGLLRSAEGLTMRAQRLVSDRSALAREYSESEMSPQFRSNGTAFPGSDSYRAHAADGFQRWRLAIDGAVGRPLSLSLAQLRAMPVRTQITRHDCVEGWSAIGKWHGVPLAVLLHLAGLGDRARYIVFHC